MSDAYCRKTQVQGQCNYSNSPTHLLPDIHGSWGTWLCNNIHCTMHSFPDIQMVWVVSVTLTFLSLTFPTLPCIGAHYCACMSKDQLKDLIWWGLIDGALIDKYLSAPDRVFITIKETPILRHAKQVEELRRPNNLHWIISTFLNHISHSISQIYISLYFSTIFQCGPICV